MQLDNLIKTAYDMRADEIMPSNEKLIDIFEDINTQISKIEANGMYKARKRLWRFNCLFKIHNLARAAAAVILLIIVSFSVRHIIQVKMAKQLENQQAKAHITTDSSPNHDSETNGLFPQKDIPSTNGAVTKDGDELDNSMPAQKDNEQTNAAPKQNENKKTDDILRGNNSLNILAEGKAAKEGEWICFTKEDGIYKRKADGSGETKLTDDIGWDLNVIDGIIYYDNASGVPSDWGIWAIDINGKNRRQVSSETANHLSVVEKTAYYEQNRQLYALNLETLKKRKILDVDPVKLLANWYVTSDGWIYYIANGDNGELYKVKTDGSDKLLVKTFLKSNLTFNIQDDWIYYEVNPFLNSGNNDGGVYRMKFDGSKVEKLSDKYGTFNMNENHLFVSVYNKDSKELNGTYQLDLDGKNEKKILDYYCTLNVVGDWIYYDISGRHMFGHWLRVSN